MLFAASVAAIAFTGCTSDEYIGDQSNVQNGQGEIAFASIKPNMTRADIVGASAADMLGKSDTVLRFSGQFQIPHRQDLHLYYGYTVC